LNDWKHITSLLVVCDEKNIEKSPHDFDRRDRGLARTEMQGRADSVAAEMRNTGT
jgi:hypothetical protein